MVYEINMEYLCALFIYPTLDEKFLQEEKIEHYIMNNNIFKEENDTPEQTLLKEAANHVVNFEDFTITIDLDQVSIEQGKSYLMAAIFLQKNTIYANITGNEKLIKKVFHVKEETFFYPEKIQAEQTLNYWSKIFNNAETKSTLIEKIKKSVCSIEKAFYIAPEFFSDPQFLEEIFSDMKHSSIPDELLKTDILMNLIMNKEEYHLFSEWFSVHIEELCCDELKKEKIVNFINSKGMLDIINFNTPQNIINRVHESTRSSKDFMEKILNHHMDDNISMSLILNTTVPEFFKSIENILLLNHCAVYFPASMLITPNMYDAWINNPQDIQKFLEAINPQSIYVNEFYQEILKIIPDSLLSEREIVKLILPYYAEKFTLLSPGFQSDNEIISVFLNAPHSNLSYIDEKILKNLTDENTIKTLVKVKPDVLAKNSTYPAAWRENIEYLAINPTMMPDYDIPDYVFDKFNDNIDLACKIVSHAPNYKRLNTNSQKEADIIFAYIDRNCTSYGDETKDTPIIEQIPQSVWINKKTCLDLLYKSQYCNDLIINKIPTAFFQDKNFILKMLKGIDESRSYYTKNLFEQLPIEIKIFLGHQKGGNYYEKLSTHIKSFELNDTLSKDLPTTPKLIKKLLKI